MRFKKPECLQIYCFKTLFISLFFLVGLLFSPLSVGDQFYTQCRKDDEAFCKSPDKCLAEYKKSCNKRKRCRTAARTKSCTVETSAATRCDTVTSCNPGKDKCNNSCTTNCNTKNKCNFCSHPNNCCCCPKPLVPDVSWLGCHFISKVLSGYAFAGYDHATHHHGNFTTGGFNPVFNFLYKDIVLAEAEVDFRIDNKGNTFTFLRYASLDFFIGKYVTLVAGKFLSPLGQFVQNIKPAWINKLPSNPPGFNYRQAAPESEVGVELRGGFPVCYSFFNYAIYVGNGPEAYIFNGVIDHITYQGTNKDEDGHKVVGGRIGFLPCPWIEFGASVAHGRVGLFFPNTNVVPLFPYYNPYYNCCYNCYYNPCLFYNSIPLETRPYLAFGFDMNFRCEEFTFRAEYIKQQIKGVVFSAVPGNSWRAYYLQMAYRIYNFEPVIRYGNYSTFQDQYRQRQIAIGFDYWFGPSVVAKIAYEFNSGRPNTINDDNRLLLQVAYGF